LTDHFGGGQSQWPEWWPGRRIVFTYSGGQQPEGSYLIDPNSPEPIFVGIGSVSWSPDRQRLAYFAETEDNLEIYLTDIATGNRKRLTNHPSDDWLPTWSADVWSPDGTRIAFVSDRTGIPEVFIVQTEGGSPVQVTRFADVLPKKEVLAGLGLSYESGDPEVKLVVPGSPAEAAGIKEGDMIVRVDGVDTKGMTHDQVAPLLKGAWGSTATVVIRRPTESGLRELVMKRVIIPSILQLVWVRRLQ
jgi:hypothetical protein